jgi:hypothetical protein
VTVATAVLTRLLRWLARVLPPGSRDWAGAVLAEAAAVPAGRARARWLVGGVRVAAMEALAARRGVTVLGFCAAAAGTAWIAWSGLPGDPVNLVNRVGATTMMLVLAGLPRLVRWRYGPGRPGRSGRLIRAGGYALILALVLAKAVAERYADAPPVTVLPPGVAWIGEILFLPTMTLYAAGILAITASRSPVRSATAAIGVTAGAVGGLAGYLLGPLGLPLRFTGRWVPAGYDASLAAGIVLAVLAPIAAGLAAARLARRRAPAHPHAPSSAQPEAPGSAWVEAPSSARPEAPSSARPEAHGSDWAEAPGSARPEAHGSDWAEAPGSAQPEAPGSARPDPASPLRPEAASPVRPATASPTRQGSDAGLCAGAAGALVMSTLSTATIALLPRNAALLGWASRHLPRWWLGGPPWLDRHFAPYASVWAAGYLFVLILAPLLATALACWPAMIAADSPRQPPPHRPPGGGTEPGPRPPAHPPGAGRLVPDALPAPAGLVTAGASP